MGHTVGLLCTASCFLPETTLQSPMSNQPSTFSSNQAPKVHCTLRGTIRITVYHSVFHCNAMPWEHNYMAQPVVSNTPHHTTDWYRLHRMIYWIILYAQDGLTPCASYWYDHRHPVTLWISTDLARKSSRTFWDVSKAQNPKRSRRNMGKSPSMSPIRLFLGMFTRVSEWPPPLFGQASLIEVYHSHIVVLRGPVPNWEVLIALSCHRLIWFYSLKQWPQLPREIRLMMVFHGIRVGKKKNIYKQVQMALYITREKQP